MPKRKKDKQMSFVVETERTYDPDPGHSEHVTTLALALFDELRALHGCGPRERRLLEIAGRLHDIGWARVVSGKHNKLSRDMILELDIPGLDEEDQLCCALIARYHTKAPPDASRHRRFASLDRERREVVEWLAALLRVADGLDCTHGAVIRNLKCKVGRRAITICLDVRGDCRTELKRVGEKQDLLALKTEKAIVFRC